MAWKKKKKRGKHGAHVVVVPTRLVVVMGMIMRMPIAKWDYLGHCRAWLSRVDSIFAARAVLNHDVEQVFKRDLGLGCWA